MCLFDSSSVLRAGRAAQAAHNVIASISSSSMLQAENSNSLKKPNPPINLVSCPCAVDSSCI